MHQEKSTKQNTHTNTFLSNKMTKNEKQNIVRKLYIFSWEIILKKWKKQRKKSKKERKKYDQVD